MVCAVSSSSCLCCCGSVARSEKLWVAIGLILAIGGILGTVYGSLGMYSATLSNGLITGGSLATLVSLFVFLRSGINMLRRVRDWVERARPAPCVYSERSIRIRQSDLSARPDHHLDQVLRVSSGLGDVSIRFYQEDSVELMAGFGSGPTRQYFSLLVQGIVQKYPSRFETVSKSALVIPKAGKEDNVDLFEKLGKLMMHCRNARMKIGCHFDPSLFAVALALSTSEVEGSFMSLDKMRYYRTLLQAQNNQDMDSVFRLLDNQDWDTSVRTEAKNLVDDEDYHDSDDALRIYLLDWLSDLYDPQLRAIHAIARGMKRVRTAWPPSLAYLEFHGEVQGSIERAAVLDQLPLFSEGFEANRKLQWIRQWIQDPRTSVQDIQQFLMYVTGSSGVTEPIGVYETDIQPNMMRVAVCSYRLELDSSRVGLESPLPLSEEDQKALFLEFFVAEIYTKNYNRA
ncbi:MAG: hypothetical protein S4CHLAM2_16970 [Chlamydiales bacterium]|nr:hypothetical protein [Chlamydiales bacterium]